VDVKAAIPSGAAPGTNEPLARIDSTGDHAETDEDDNLVVSELSFEVL